VFPAAVDSRDASVARRGADALQLVLAATAVVLALRGLPPPVCLGVAVAVPALRALASAAYRERLRAWFAWRWAALADYPVRTQRVPWRAALAFAALPAVPLLVRDYSFFSGDSQPVVQTATSLVRDGDSALDEFAAGPCAEAERRPYYWVQTPTGIHSAYPSGMVPFALPAAAGARLVGADLDDHRVRTRLERWTAAALMAACLALFLLTALHMVPAGPAWAVTLMLGLGSALFTIVGQALWQHGGLIFWGLLAVLLEFRQARQPSRAATALQGLACALMLACRLTAGPFVLAFGAWVLLRQPRRLPLLIVGAALGYAPWTLFHISIYGQLLGPTVSAQGGSANWSWGNPQAWAGVLISPGRGVLVYQPWLLLAGLAFIPAVRRTPGRGPCPAGWEVFCAVVVLAHLALISGWACWWGGHCWGSRLATDVIPLGALLCLRPVAALWATVGGRRLVVGLIVLGWLLHVRPTLMREDRWNHRPKAIDEHPERLWSWSDAPFFYHLRRR
jgi:hypothetical protein